MVDQRTTDVDPSPIMILGGAVTTKDLGGRPRGVDHRQARRRDPVGSAPLYAREVLARPRSRCCRVFVARLDGRAAISGYASR